MKTVYLIVLAFWLTLITATCHCQTLCVEPPLQAQPDAPLRQQVEDLFRQEGFYTNCSSYDYEITFYYLGGVGTIDVTNVIVSHTESPGVVYATVITDKPRLPVGGWTMVVRRRCEVASLIRVHSGSIDKAVKGTVKSIRRL